MDTLTVSLGERSYPIYIGSGLLSRPDLLRQHVAGDQTMTVSNEIVAPLYLARIDAAVSGLRHDAVILHDGEQFKNLDTLNSVFTALLEKRHDRGTTLIALGGGVVGDITGFAAASYQRGVDFIQVPTTLLAQVDSSVGGKTGVNHPLGKNMIGAFHQPRCVVIDTDTLDTLDDRQMSAGLAEVIKYGLIVDESFFAWLEENIEALMRRDKNALQYAICESCASKARVVADDERERSGRRALLNLGHTFGHAIETGTGYGAWLHGEAVGCGMVMAADLSQRMGWLDAGDVARIRDLVRRARLPDEPPASMDAERFISLMSVDKKVQSGHLRLVLLRALGDAVVSDDFDAGALRATLEAA